jgi:serine/threonine protein kinase
LNKAIVLTAAPTVKDKVALKSEEIKKWFELLKYFGVLQNLKCHYEIGNLIGSGNFSKVYEVTHSAKKRKFALKTINKEMFKDNIKSVLSLNDEISLLRKIRHPNVLQMYEIFESENNVHLILEHLNGKELFD